MNANGNWYVLSVYQYVVSNTKGEWKLRKFHSSLPAHLQQIIIFQTSVSRRQTNPRWMNFVFPEDTSINGSNLWMQDVIMLSKTENWINSFLKAKQSVQVLETFVCSKTVFKSSGVGVGSIQGTMNLVSFCCIQMSHLLLTCINQWNM